MLLGKPSLGSAGTSSRREMLKRSSVALASAFCSRLARADAENAGHAEDASGANRPNLLVFLVDSLRPDFLGCAGYPVPITPRIDALAAEGVRFDGCHSCASWTKPSIASLFTGVLPRVHQTASSKDFTVEKTGNMRSEVLSECIPALAELLETSGYDTGYFVGPPLISRAFGFDRGFSHYEECFDDTIDRHVNRVIEWIDKKAVSPFFAMMHVNAAHHPYLPSPGTFSALFGKPPLECVKTMAAFDQQFLTAYLKHGGMPFRGWNNSRPSFGGLSPQGLEFVKQLYAARIAESDRAFGRLLDALEQKGLSGNTLVAVTADHGEAFKEHQFFYHCGPLYEEQMHIPLVMRLPGARPSGVCVSIPVSMLDLHATLLSFANVPAWHLCQGYPLFLEDGAPDLTEGRAAWANHDLQSRTGVWDSAMVLGAKKVLTLKGMETTQVFDLDADPGETTDLLAGAGGTDPAIRALLERFRIELEKHAELEEQFRNVGGTVKLDPDTKRKLEALGYL